MTRIDAELLEELAKTTGGAFVHVGTTMSTGGSVCTMPAENQRRRSSHRCRSRASMPC